MCNLSEYFEEKVTEKVTENVKEKIAIKMILKGSSNEDIIEITELPLARIVELRERETCCV